MAALHKLSPEALLSLGSMEGVYDLPVVETKRAEKSAAQPVPLWHGWLAAILVSAVALAVHYLPFAPFRVEGPSGVRRPVSAAIVAIFLGAIAGNLLPLGTAVLAGAKHAARRVIPATIVLIGATLSFSHAASVGSRAFVIVCATMTAAMLSAMALGRMLGIWTRTSILIGAGTAICGNSAIVAVAPLIDAEDRDVMLSMGAINVLGLVLMFLSPFLGGLLGMSDQGYGVWAGSTIHAVPQAVAAGFAFSEKAGGMATLVKLVRVALLAPMLLALAFAYARTRKDRVTVHYGRLVPPFLWGFFALFLFNSLGWLPTLQFASGFSVSSADALEQIGSILLALAMAAMGLEVNLKFFRKVGGAALIVGAASCAIACFTSWALIRWLL